MEEQDKLTPETGTETEPVRQSVDAQLWEAGLPVPGEVVEYYQHQDGKEVVEYYVQDRPLPGQKKSAPAVRRGSRRGLWVFLLCLLVLTGVSAGIWLWSRGQVEPPAGEVPGGYTEDTSGEGVSLPVYPEKAALRLTARADHGAAMTAQEIYARVNPAVVTVLVDLKGGEASVGTGVILSQDGYILTNYHVVEGGHSCQITLADNRQFDNAMYVAGDQDNDLAVLKVDGEDLPTAEIGASDSLVVGDKVYAIGNPLGVELRGTFTDGIVSAINRDVELDDGRVMTLVQTNAALNSGNSGGPLINIYGQVVGINTIKMSSAFSSIEGLGFAIPTSSMQYIVNDLLEYGKVQPQPRLGIMVEKISTTLPDGTQGARIDSVTEGGAGDLAGLRQDDVIVQAGGERVTTSADLLRIRRAYRVGEEMTLRVWRDGAYLEVTLTLQGEETQQSG